MPLLEAVVEAHVGIGWQPWRRAQLFDGLVNHLNAALDGSQLDAMA